MINSKIRTFLATLHTLLFCAMLLSESLFIHQHSTSSGKIVIHLHPYNFADGADNPDHHASEEEIYFFEVIFQAQFALSTPVDFQAPVVTPPENSYNPSREDPCLTSCYGLFYLRGPPLLG